MIINILEFSIFHFLFPDSPPPHPSHSSLFLTIIVLDYCTSS